MPRRSRAWPYHVLCWSLIAWLCFLIPARAQEGWVSDQEPAAKTYERIFRLSQENKTAKRIMLPIWQRPSQVSRRSVDSQDISVPKSLIDRLQHESRASVQFVESPMEPAPLAIWSWREHASMFFLFDNQDQVGLSKAGVKSIARWAVGGLDSPLPRRALCHWWSESQPDIVRDFLLFDQPQEDRGEGCLAAGLLRPLGNPIWKLVYQRAIDQSRSQVPNTDYALYGCALRVQAGFVKEKKETAISPQTEADFRDLVLQLDQRVHGDCLGRV